MRVKMNEIMNSPLTALPVIHAVAKRAAELEKGCRAEADAILRDTYAKTGATRLDLKVGETKTGTLSLNAKKAHAEVTDPARFSEWCAQAYGDGECEEFFDVSQLTEDDKRALMKWARRTKRDHLVSRRVILNGVDEKLVLDSLKGVRTETGWAPMTPEGVVAEGVKWVPESTGASVLRGCRPDEVMEAAALNRIDPFEQVRGLLDA